MIVTQNSDPRAEFYVVATYTMPRHKKAFHSLERFPTLAAANAAADKWRAQGDIMAGDNLDMMRKLVEERMGVTMRAETTIDALRNLHPPRSDIQVLQLRPLPICDGEAI